ncbi:MAG TPA: PKD domain-containing protein, partial [Solirubrobacteraceae bacterium]|nr:PKD domain-containing protein [Solirubrobacteraceae bacterium]
MSRIRVSLLLTFAFAFALSALSVATARASVEGYGELGHFGSAGTGAGQFKLTGPTTNGTNGTRAFGVDTSENAVYVGDEPKAKEYRIQKLTAGGVFVAATPIFKPPNRDGIEGVAFDPVLKRLYVLALERRSVSLENDPSKAAAGTLYAFSTEAVGEVLPAAAGTVEGVLTGPTTFGSQSDALESALIDPKGIAVDPTTHEVIVTGEVDEGEEARSFALQRVDASTGALGERYVDRGSQLRQESELNSPVVSPGGAVYVEQREKTEGDLAQIVRIPSDFTSQQAPTPFIPFILKGGLESETNAVVEFANGSGGESLESGGGLSLSPEADGKATLYAEARAFFKPSGTEFGNSYTAALAFSDLDDSEGFELGWTGGQSRQTTESCAIGASGAVSPMVAGGSQGTVFILDSRFAHVVEFGPGGSGCPTAEAGALTASVGGAPLSGTIPAGTEVTLATSLTRANALSVEWSFGEGKAKPQIVSADEYQHTQVIHTFEEGGELTVTETIHTDNLATPTIVKTIGISVSTNHLPPVAVAGGPLSIAVGQPGIFDGSASWDPNGVPGSSPIASYHWDFGDGSSASSTTPEVEHAYAQAGVYAVKLTVVDGFGLESEASKIEVTAEVPNPAAPPTSATPGSVVGPPSPSALTEQPPAPTTGKASSSQSSVVPDARLSGASLKVATNGRVPLVITCPGGASGCVGVVTLQTLGPVAVAQLGDSHKRSTKAVLTLAKGSFALAGGQ